MVRLSEETILNLNVLAEFYGEWHFYRKDDAVGLELINRFRAPKMIYYVGPYLDLAPLFELDGNDYYYQERHEILHNVKSALGYLQTNGVISELQEITHVGKDQSHAEFRFSFENHKKNFHILQESDVLRDGIVPEVKKADLIYAYNSLVTDEMLENAKPGCLILDHPGLELDKYLISERQINGYNLILVVYPDTDKSIFEYSHLYEKRQQKNI